MTRILMLNFTFKNQVYNDLKKWMKNVSVGCVFAAMVACSIPEPAPAFVLPYDNRVSAAQSHDTHLIEKNLNVPVAPAIDNEDNIQIRCLAQNIYFEAGNQSETGKLAVANVVINRTRDTQDRFPKTPCGVVKQKRGRTCQFSWVCNNPSVHDQKLYTESVRLAKKVYLDQTGDVTNGAKFFHAKSIRPAWSHMYVRSASIGDHIFYRG